MVGGPGAGQLPEHAHADLQITVHLGARSKVQLIEPEQPHAGRWDRGVHVGVMLLAPTLIDETGEDIVARGRPRFRSAADTGDALIAELARAVIADFTRPPRPSRRLFFEAIGYTLAGHLVRTYGDVRLRAPDRATLDARQLARIDDYIEAMLATTITVRAMAELTGWSPRRFAEAFKRTTGRTPYQHVVHRRLAAARRLLRTTNLSIAEIALRLGFANQSHFTALFTRAVGMTPRRWRAS